MRHEGRIRGNPGAARVKRELLVAVLFALILVLAAPFAAGASTGAAAQGIHSLSPRRTYVQPQLLHVARTHPRKLVRVIIQSKTGVHGAQSAFAAVHGIDGASAREAFQRRLGLVDGVVVRLEAGKLQRLLRMHGLTVTPDAPVRLADVAAGKTAYNSTQLWPYEARFAKLWYDGQTQTPAPTIAVVDSGIDANRADFGNRVIASVNLSRLSNNSPGDGRGHGTFVAGIAAGAASGYTGAAPSAKLVSIDVMDDEGMARTSDIITACQWILANKDAYNIRVANFSLHSTMPSNFTRDPLDKAVEKLWFGGVTVVAASGNYGDASGPSGVRYAPGNDPFAITVGATDIAGTLGYGDDSAASWSAWGYTYDGFAKPDLSAPGRYMVGPVPANATLIAERPDALVAPGYLQASGTSFSAPAVAGAAAQILARHPAFTPDQVKGALMLGAKPAPNAAPGSLGVGELDATRSAAIVSPPNPNRALERFLGVDPSGDALPAFNAVGWLDAAKSDKSWDAISWTDIGWSDAAWSAVSWEEVAWSDISWTDISWTDVSWADVSWTDSAKEDAADADASYDGSYELTPEDVAAMAADPTAAAPADALPADLSSSGS